MRLGTIDADRHGVPADRLAHAKASVDENHRTAIADYLCLLAEVQSALAHGRHILWQHANAMGIVSREICLDQMLRNPHRLLVIAPRRTADGGNGLAKNGR